MSSEVQGVAADDLYSGTGSVGMLNIGQARVQRHVSMRVPVRGEYMMECPRSGQGTGDMDETTYASFSSVEGRGVVLHAEAGSVD